MRKRNERNVESTKRFENHESGINSEKLKETLGRHGKGLAFENLSVLVDEAVRKVLYLKEDAINKTLLIIQYFRKTEQLKL